MVEILIAVAALVLNLAGEAVQGGFNNMAIKYQKLLMPIAQKLYSQIAHNQKALDNLVMAYQNKNASMVNDMVQQAGFGPAFNSVKKQIDQAEQDYKKERDQLTNEITEDTNKYNKVTTAMNTAGQGIAGAKNAESVYQQTQQLVDGGAQEEVNRDIKNDPILNGPRIL